MRTRDLMLSIVVASALAACGKDEPRQTGGTSTTDRPAGPSGALPMPTTPAAAHEPHDPKHGGRVLELGEHEGHLEVVHDRTAGTLTAYVYDADMKPIESEAPVVNLVKGGVQIPMTPVSGSGPRTDAWRAAHDALKADVLEGRVRVKIGDRTYQPDLQDEHE